MPLRFLVALFAALTTLSHADPVLKQGDTLTMCGDSITQQGIYTTFVDDYIHMCQPVTGIKTIQCGWGGTTAPHFAEHMKDFALAFSPTVATTAFGMNDGHEEFVGNSRLEIGYYAFRDPAYVPLLKRSPQRDLIYGVPDLPDTTNQPFLQSSCAENLGFALLRSQTSNRPPREQIQAVFKIGTQGGYHGHFDRASLDSIMRYGRSFWNPESIWWGYGNFMYKFYVQNSVNHNMVVVDQKQQEAVPSSQLLFYSGKMMQVSVQETDARWSDPPYGGMVYGAQGNGHCGVD